MNFFIFLFGVLGIGVTFEILFSLFPPIPLLVKVFIIVASIFITVASKSYWGIFAQAIKIGLMEE